MPDGQVPPTFRDWRETEGRGRSPWPRARHEGDPFLRFSNKDRVSRLSQGRDKRMLESPDLAWICQLRPQSGGWGEKAQDGVTSVWWVDPRAWSPQGHQGVTHCAPRWQSVQAGVLHGQEWTPPCWWVVFSITRSWEAQARHGSGGWTQSQLFPAVHSGTSGLERGLDRNRSCVRRADCVPAGPPAWRGDIHLRLDKSVGKNLVMTKETDKAHVKWFSCQTDFYLNLTEV